MRRIVPQLIRLGAVQRPSLGIQPAADPIARSFKVSEGVMIQTAEPKGPAAVAGLLPTRRGLGGVVAGEARDGDPGRRAGTRAGAGAARRGPAPCLPSRAGVPSWRSTLQSRMLTPACPPHARAMHAGDVIVSLAGRPVRDLFDLTSILDEADVGDEVEVVALRGVDQQGQPQRVTVRARLEAEAA